MAVTMTDSGETTRILSRITDQGFFERLATAILREGKRAAPAVQMVHCDAANLARDHPSVMRYHRKFKHHSVSVVTDDTSPRERH